MNIKTAQNINRDLVKLIRFYIAAGRAAHKPFNVAATAANIKNLAYYNYTHHVQYGFKTFNAYHKHFASQEFIPLCLAAGMGTVKIKLIPHNED